MYRDYNILLAIYKNNWFASVDWPAEFFHSTYNKAGNFAANLKEFVRRKNYNNLSLNEKNVYVTYKDWQKKTLEEKGKCVLIRFGTAANPISNAIQPKQTRFFVSQKLHVKVSTNFLKDRKFILEFVITHQILKKIREKIH